MLRKRVLSIIGVIGITVGGLTVGTTTPAFAQSYWQWCIASHGCLNNWNDGPNVKNYNPNFLQNAVTAVQDTYRCNGGFTTASCPIPGIPAGQEIVELKNDDPDSPWNGDCYGDLNGSATDARVGDDVACDNGSANGGYGILYIYAMGFSFGCSGQTVFVNVHWTSNWNSPQGIGWTTGSVGNQVYQNSSTLLCGTFQSFTPQ